MNIRDAKTVLKTMIENKVKLTPMLWARHGIGKSSIVNQLGKELGYKVFSILLSQKEAVDVAGVLYTYKDETLGMSVTSAHPPIWFADAVKNGKVIIFLDEFNMARRDVMNAAFELVLDHRLNNIKLPESTFVICAGNPDDDRYDVTPMSESLRDRLLHLHVKADIDPFLEWANKAGIDSRITQFLKVTPKAAYSEDERDNEFPVEIKHSFRSWEHVALMLELPLPKPLLVECVRGLVGLDVTNAFFTFANDIENAPLTATDIMNFNATQKSRVKKYASGNNMRIDVLSASVDNLIEHAKNDSKTLLEHFEGVREFICLLPDDLASKAMLGLHTFPNFAQMFMDDKTLRSIIEKINKTSRLDKSKSKK